MIERLTHPWGPLIALSLGTTAVLCFGVFGGFGFSPFHELVLQFVWALTLILWMEADARRLRPIPCFDFGLLAAIFFPLSVAWYCWWSRRWQGLLTLLLLMALWLTPYFLATFLENLLWSIADSPS
jgi:hypothetical protein